jgi:hypothetical protein
MEGGGNLGGLPYFLPTGLPTEDLSVTCTPPKLSLALLCLPERVIMTLKKCVLIHKLEDYANFTLSKCDVMMMSLHFPVGSKLHNCCLCIIAPVPHVCIYTNVYMLRLVVYSNTAALLPPFTSPTGHNIQTLSICMYRPCNWSNIYIQHQCAITIIIGRGEEA